MECTIVCGYKPVITDKLKGPLIGVDKGAFKLVQKGYICDIAIGDFDSCVKEELIEIEKHSKEIIKLNPIKDDTDLEHAINLLCEKGYTKADIYGCLGGRQDHNFLNLKLLYQSKMELRLIDEKSLIYVLKPGSYEIKKNGYTYLSFFSLKENTVSISGVKYPLYKQKITVDDNYTSSNEILNESCIIEIEDNPILIMQVND